MRNLLSQSYQAGPPMPVNIEPCWFTGPRAEVIRKYNEFIEILDDENLDMADRINAVKHSGTISEPGNY